MAASLSPTGRTRRPVFTSEFLLGAVGCALACASSAFALYTNLDDTRFRHLPNSGYFTVFAQLSGFRPEARSTRSPAFGKFGDIDPVSTGSIKGDVGAAKDRAPPLPPAAPPEKPTLSGYLLRESNDQTALIEMNDRLLIFKMGETVPGAGRVVGLKRQNGVPVLETSQGFILGSR